MSYGKWCLAFHSPILSHTWKKTNVAKARGHVQLIPAIVEYSMVTLLSVPLHVNISSRYRKLPLSTSSTVKLSHSSTGGMVWVNPLRQGSINNYA